MDRMTSYHTLNWEGKIRKSINIDLVTISSTLTDDIVVLLAVQVDVTGEHTRPDAVSPIFRDTKSQPSPMRSYSGDG
jgi:hypothetical protein